MKMSLKRRIVACHVRFADTLTTHVDDHRSAETVAEDCQNAWYLPEDIARFARTNFVLGMIVRTRGLLSPSLRDDKCTRLSALMSMLEDEQLRLRGHSSRGLESTCDRSYCVERRQRKIAVVGAVLLEQKRQRARRECDPVAIAKVACAETEEAKCCAIVNGIIDALLVSQRQRVISGKRQRQCSGKGSSDVVKRVRQTDHRQHFRMHHLQHCSNTFTASKEETVLSPREDGAAAIFEVIT